MMVRTQIALDRETQERARRKAAEMGISLAEYVRRAVARDLGVAATKPDVSILFDLGSSGGSDITHHKDEMIGEAFAASRRKLRKSA
jgi:hypothetical protein